MTYGGRLVELPTEEAWAYLASTQTGRIAWNGPEGLSIIPLNFTVVDGRVWLRTAPYSTWLHDVVGREVAFEADETDAFTRSGWSVLIRGVLQLADGMETPPEAVDAPAWPAGSRIQHMYVSATKVTARQLLPS